MVDVKYVLGGEENQIELEYVQEHSFDDDKTSRRKRSTTTRFTQEDTNISSTKKNKKKNPLKDATLKKTSQANTVVDKTKKPITKVAKVENPKIQSIEQNESISNMTEGPEPVRGVSSFLKNVYSEMTNKATSFVKEIVGGKESEPSSPDSWGSLEVKIRDE